MHVDIGFEQYVKEAGLIMDNLEMSFGKSWSELRNCNDDFKVLVQAGITSIENLSEDQAKKMKSVIDRMKSALSEVTFTFEDVMQDKAEMMGRAFEVDNYARELFSEEVIRGSLFFSLSMILKKIDNQVRERANLGDW